MRTEYRVDKVPFFKHCEEFRLGRETVMGRRDKKSGQQRAFLREVPEGLQIDIQLDQPFPGLSPSCIVKVCLAQCSVATKTSVVHDFMPASWHASIDFSRVTPAELLC